MAMQPGKPIIGQDAVVFLDKETKQTLVQFNWFNHDIFTEVDVYLVRNDKSKTLITQDLKPGSQDTLNTGAKIEYRKKTNNDGTTSNEPVLQWPGGRFVAIPNTKYTVLYYFTKVFHVDPFKKKYPVYKFRIEMVGNPNIFAESNEFKVVW